MDLRTALLKARSLLQQHGLEDWSIGLDRARRRAGACHYATKTISLSRPLTALHSPEEVRDTILHEVAHALVGPSHGHDAVWRARALAIGCSGSRCVPEDAPKLEGNWIGVCPQGHQQTKHKRPERVVSCSRCGGGRFDPTHLITWTWRDVAVRMHPKYVAELVRLADKHGGIPADQLELDGMLGGGPGHPQVQGFLAPLLPVGARVRITGDGQYAGLMGTVLSRGRSRYKVKTDRVVLQVSPRLLEAASDE